MIKKFTGSSGFFLKKETYPEVPPNRDFIISGRGYSLHDGEKWIFSLLQVMANSQFCEYRYFDSNNNRRNNYYLNLWMPVQKEMTHDLLDSSDEHFTISPAEYRVVNTFQLSKPMPIKHEKYAKWRCFSIHPDFIKNVLERLEIKKPVESLEFSATPKPKDRLLNTVISIFEEGFKNTGLQDNSLLVETAVLQLVMLLIKNHPNSFKILSSKKNLKENHPAIKNALDFMRDNFDKNISLDAIAFSSGLNKYYLIELFKRETGQTPFSYINNYRIEKAKELLKQHKLTIREIAEAVGYEDDRHFRRIFKLITGYPPSKLYT